MAGPRGGADPTSWMSIRPEQARKLHQVRFGGLVVPLRWPTLYGILTGAQATYIVDLFPASHFRYLFLSPHKLSPSWGRWICRGGKPGRAVRASGVGLS